VIQRFKLEKSIAAIILLEILGEDGKEKVDEGRPEKRREEKRREEKRREEKRREEN